MPLTFLWLHLAHKLRRRRRGTQTHSGDAVSQIAGGEVGETMSRIDLY